MWGGRRGSGGLRADRLRALGSRGELPRLIAIGALVSMLLVGVMLAAAAPSGAISTPDIGRIALALLLVAGVVIAGRIIAALASLRLRAPNPLILLGLAAVFVLFWAALSRVDAKPKSRSFPRSSTTQLPPTVGKHAPIVSDSLITVILAILAVAAVALAAAQALRWWRDRAGTVDAITTPISKESLVAAIDAALFDLHGQQDNRRAVIAAYAAAESTLAAHGAPRRLSESPIEYLDRILRLLGASGAAVDQLTALYEQARFSEHIIDTAMRLAAIAAFETLRSELQPVT